MAFNILRRVLLSYWLAQSLHPVSLSAYIHIISFLTKSEAIEAFQVL
jgi:hypothetical protein